MTDNENKEPDVIETLPEEDDSTTEPADPSLVPRLDVKRRSNKRLHRHHSTKRGED